MKAKQRKVVFVVVVKSGIVIVNSGNLAFHNVVPLAVGLIILLRFVFTGRERP